MASLPVIFFDTAPLTLLKTPSTPAGGNDTHKGTFTAWTKHTRFLLDTDVEPVTGQCTIQGLTNCNNKTGAAIFYPMAIWSDSASFVMTNSDSTHQKQAEPLSSGTNRTWPMNWHHEIKCISIVTFERIHQQIMIIHTNGSSVMPAASFWVALPDGHPVHDLAKSLVTTQYNTQADPQVLTFASHTVNATGKSSIPMPVNGLLSRNGLAIFNTMGCSQLTLHLNWPYTPEYTNDIKKKIHQRIAYGHIYPAEILRKANELLKFIRVDEKDPLLGNWYGDWPNRDPGLGIYIAWKKYAGGKWSTALPIKLDPDISQISIMSAEKKHYVGGIPEFTQYFAVVIVREHCVERYTQVQSPPVLESPFNSIGPTPKCTGQDRIARYSSIQWDYATAMSQYR